MTLDELTKIALLGTARATLPEPADLADDDEKLSAALAAVRTGVPEDDLLAAAAVLSAYESCGRPADVPPPVALTLAPSDQRPACSQRAGALLEQIFSQPNTPSKQRLLTEWLVAAASTNCRVPHGMLPALLDYGASTRAVREAVAAVIDQRGTWLMSLNHRWQFAAPDAMDAAPIWATGNREQRSMALRRLRETSTAAARDLVISTWKEDAADERSSFVDAFSVNVGPEDEAFLEAALDDGSKQVRAAAASVLSRLTESGFLQRMQARALPLLLHRPAEKGGLLTKGKAATVELQLPADSFDPISLRDGIEEKPPGRMGRRQWWATQILSSVPPSVWSTIWQLEPVACVAAAAGDFRSLLLDAWSAAAERHNDVEWMKALLAESIHAKPAGDQNALPRLSLLKHLPSEAQRDLLTVLVGAADLDMATLQQVLQSVDVEFDPKAATAVCDAIDRTLRKAGDAYHYGLAGVLETVVHQLPPTVADGLSQAWSGAAWDANRRALDAFFFTLQLRRDIQTEFKS